MLDEDDLKTFIRICGRLGSDHDGECVAAAKAATKFLAKHSLTWEEVLTPSERPMMVASVTTDDDRSFDPPPDLSWVAAAKLCLEEPAALKNDREIEFLVGIIQRSQRWPTLTDKQGIWLADICGRRGVAWTW